MLLVVGGLLLVGFVVMDHEDLLCTISHSN